MHASSSGRFPAFEEFVEYFSKKPDVWVATREQIARHWKGKHLLTMDALQGVHQRVKSSMVAGANKQTEEIALADGVCGYFEVSHVAKCLFISC
ncbi:hypothetical protein BJ912DRAFT_150300 [Pholiota molesta]|nr:hypothetical protein BJ912DRAFT_150300 [Pholiota molesta]